MPVLRRYRLFGRREFPYDPMLFQRIATAPSGARGSSGAPRLAESPRILPGPDLPVQAEAADRPHHASSVDEEVRRRRRNPGEAPPFPCAKALLRHALVEQGVRRRAGPGLDRTLPNWVAPAARTANG